MPRRRRRSCERRPDHPGQRRTARRWCRRRGWSAPGCAWSRSPTPGDQPQKPLWNPARSISQAALSLTGPTRPAGHVARHRPCQGPLAIEGEPGRRRDRVDEERARPSRCPGRSGRAPCPCRRAGPARCAAGSQRHSVARGRYRARGPARHSGPARRARARAQPERHREDDPAVAALEHAGPIGEGALGRGKVAHQVRSRGRRRARRRSTRRPPGHRRRRSGSASPRSIPGCRRGTRCRPRPSSTAKRDHLIPGVPGLDGQPGGVGTVRHDPDAVGPDQNDSARGPLRRRSRRCCPPRAPALVRPDPFGRVRPKPWRRPCGRPAHRAGASYVRPGHRG